MCQTQAVIELLTRAFTLGAQSRPSTSQHFSKALVLQRECDIIIKLDIVSLRFSHYDLGRVKPKFRCCWGEGACLSVCDEEGQDVGRCSGNHF